MHKEDYSGMTQSLISDYQRGRTRRRLKDAQQWSGCGASVDMQLTKPEVALLILDMQNYFLKSDSHAFIPAAEAIIPRIARLRKSFLEAGHPVIFTRHANTVDNAGMMASWWRELMSDDNPLNRITDDLSTEGCHVLTKPQYDAFYGTALTDMLKGVQSLVITGVMTHICAETTARSGFVRGFEIFFTADGTATYNLDLHRGSLAGLSHGFAHIVTCQEAEVLL